MLNETQIGYYESALDLLPETVQKVLNSESVSDYFTEFAAAAEDNPRVIIETFQSLLIWGEGEYDLATLIENAPLAQQRAIDPKSVGRILTDSNTGLLSIGELLEPIVLAQRPDGALSLISGNHRIASLYSMLMLGGADPEVIASQSVRVRTVRVDMESLADRLSEEDEDGEIIEPTAAELNDAANDIIFAMWISANQSRTVQASEISDARQYKNNIKREPRAVANAIKQGMMTINEARLYLASYFAIHAVDESARLEPRSVTPATVPVNFVINGSDLTLKRQTLEGVIKSFFASLKKVKNEKGSYKYVLDLKDFDETCEILHRVFLQEDGNVSLFEYAISQVIEETGESNISRKSAFHGAKLAELYAGSYDETYPNVPKDNAQTRKRGKKSLGIV
jgi:hypothetical protein